VKGTGDRGEPVSRRRERSEVFLTIPCSSQYDDGTMKTLRGGTIACRSKQKQLASRLRAGEEISPPFLPSPDPSPVSSLLTGLLLFLCTPLTEVLSNLMQLSFL
jgi:hypothetical protein